MPEEQVFQTKAEHQDWGSSEAKEVVLLKALDHKHQKEIASHQLLLKKEDRTHTFACFVSAGILILCGVEVLGNYAGKREVAFTTISNVLFLALGIIFKASKINLNNN